MSEFFAMGGYAGYVWSAYAIAGLVMLANIIVPRQRERRQLRELARGQASDHS